MISFEDGSFGCSQNAPPNRPNVWAMTFRVRFFALFSIAALAATGFLAWGATQQARQTYERFDGERDATLTMQFQREFAQRGQEVSYAMQGLADAEATLRMVLDLSRPQADPSVYANDARGLATAHQLDFLDLVAGDGTLISSAQWPARSGYKNDWVSTVQDWNQRSAFLQRVDLPDGIELGLLAVRSVTVGEKTLYLIGGLRFDREFLRAVALPAGTRALLYSHFNSTYTPESLASADGQVDQPERFAEIVQAAERSSAPSQQTIQWTADRASTENFVAIPLAGRQNEALGVVFFGSTQRELVTLQKSILIWALVAAVAIILAGILLSGWAAARTTKPLVQLAAGVHQVTAGNWAAQVNLRSREEAGQVGQAFNEMTAQISRERARLVQTERVAAWRDVAQRMTQEVKHYLFPIEVTVSGLTRARVESSPRFGEVLNESLSALRTELDQLKAAVNRFSEFAKMPQPRCKPVDVNEILRGVLLAFEPQFRALGRPPITPELFLDNKTGKILADSDLLRRALENLLLHSIDTMPAGGTLTVRTEESSGIVRIQISGSGAGFGTEQRADPFTAFRARQTPGAALGLPTTQAVVSDHGGRFFAETVPGVGTTFFLEFAVTREVAAPAAMQIEPPKRAIQHELPEIPEAVLESIPAASPAPPQPADPPALNVLPAPPSPAVVSALAASSPADPPSSATPFGPAPTVASSVVLPLPIAFPEDPKGFETKSESLDVSPPAPVPAPALETIPSAPPSPSQHDEPQRVETVALLPPAPLPASVAVAPRKRSRGLLPSLLGLDLPERETRGESAENHDTELHTIPPAPLFPPPVEPPVEAPVNEAPVNETPVNEASIPTEHVDSN